ncbi:hypothetical protein [Nocardia alba]|uniref:Uncharacterized protein n=1 Tax=Nocardia alba TaxID=225051 RepID=A0A4R1FNV7_9NOCA|nr:hypothetical protein [Nocardia alba]TCJ96487.1 hypothetical protein DFR71_2517 [Nocardia alba]
MRRLTPAVPQQSLPELRRALEAMREAGWLTSAPATPTDEVSGPRAPALGRSPCPDEPDIHLAIQFPSVRMEFAACLTAALVFVCDVAARRPGTVAVYPSHCTGLPRLPNERLYLQP